MKVKRIRFFLIGDRCLNGNSEGFWVVGIRDRSRILVDYFIVLFFVCFLMGIEGIKIDFYFNIGSSYSKC